MLRLALTVMMLAGAATARADAVVTDGRFTNVYVYVPDTPGQTWDQHMQQWRPSDWQSFTRASIDHFTDVLMAPSWPSYFGALHQYAGINPPQFFGSYVASADCVAAAIKDLHGGTYQHGGILEETTIRSLANCHASGMDPSPQVNLIFSPQIHVGDPTALPSGNADGPDMCVHGKTAAYHAFGLNTPNFAVLPTDPKCAGGFTDFTTNVSHEDVEMISDPGQTAHGGFTNESELADQCENKSPATVVWNGYTVQRYRSDNDDTCWPLPVPSGSTTTIWVLAEGSPKIRFTGSVHTLDLAVPPARQLTDARATDVQIWIQTGGDDLRGGDDNAEVTLTYAGGTTLTKNINAKRQWGNGQTHIAELTLPATAPRVSDLRGVTIGTHFSGGIGGDNWNVDRVALVVAFPSGSATTDPVVPIVHTWLDASGGPLVRFTGSVHEHVESVAAQDAGKKLRALSVIVSTGNDDLRGGNDNCDVVVELTNGSSITVTNANGKQAWKDWTDHAVAIPLPTSGLVGGGVKAVKLVTHFGGGVGGDNWNVQRVRLVATLE